MKQWSAAFHAANAASVNNQYFYHYYQEKIDRLNKNILYSYIPEDKTMDILFIYLHDEIFEYGKIEKAITGAIKKIRSYIEKDGSGDIADTH